MKDFVKRMIKERDELKERIDKAEDFYHKADNGDDITLSRFEMEYLYEQIDYMKDYFRVLNTRIGYYAEIEE